MFSDLMKYEIIFIFININFFIFIFIFTFTKLYYSKLFNLNNNTVGIGYKILYKNFIDNSKQIVKYVLKFLLQLYIFFFFNFNYYFSYVNNSYLYNFCINNFNWYYCLFILILLIISFIIFLKLLNYNLIKSIELILGLHFFFMSIYFLLFFNNIIAVIFLFELQSLIFIYILASSYTTNNKLQQFKWYFNSLMYQFWVSFISALLLIYGALSIYRFSSFVEWDYIEIFFYFINYSWLNVFQLKIFIIWLPILLGFLLKLGFFPFFLWKPEIYKNLNIIVLFIYMSSYLFSLLFFLINFFYNYFYLIYNIWYLFFYILIILSFILISFMLYSITELRQFLAYTSIIHICFIFLSMFSFKVINTNITYFYLFVYLFFIFFFFIIIFSLPNNMVWFLTDLQYLTKIPVITTSFSVLMLGMAGIPPFLGFFAKLSVVSNMLVNEDYFLFFLSIFIGLFVSFFYIQNYRFYGFNLKNIYYNKSSIVYKFNNKLFFWLYFFIFINVFSIFFVNDFFILVTSLVIFI